MFASAENVPFDVHNRVLPRSQPKRKNMSTETCPDERIVLSSSVVPRLAAFEAARRELPGVELAFDEFCSHLDALGYGTELPKHLASVYLCCACALQRPTGLRTLEEVYFPAVRAAIARARVGADVVDDVLQTVRERLLVEPKVRIATYRGNGPLCAWLGVIANNAVRDRVRSRREPQSAHETYWSRRRTEPVLVESPEWVSLSRERVGLVESALLRAIRGLETKQRRLLHLHFVDGLGIDTLGQLFGIHRSSAARRINRILAHLAHTIHQQLLAHDGLLEAREFEELMPGLCGNLGTELATLLAC
jgi:RNA polymerase sigma-70 factor, ECF subfamily